MNRGRQAGTRRRGVITLRPGGARTETVPTHPAGAVRIVGAMDSERADAASPFPRPLTGREAEILEFMLSAGFPGDEVLREQARHALVIEQCTCGCATVDFGLAADAPVAPEIQGAPLVQTRARDMEEHPVSLMLFVREGRLSSLEIVWFDESQTTGEFPTADFWEPPTASSGYDERADEPDVQP
jgi:hypothetical protein